MKILSIPTNYTSTKTTNTISFQRNIDAELIQKAQQLINEKRTVRDIRKELGIAIDTYYRILEKLGIPYKKKTPSENISSITKEKIDTFLKNGLSVPQICQELKLTAYSYYKLARELGIKNLKSAIKEQNASVSKEQLVKLINEKLSVKEICEKLGITQSAYFSLIKKLNIQTAQKEAKTRNSLITKEQLTELLQAGKSAAEIRKELSISETTYMFLLKKFGIETQYALQKQHIASITKEQLLKFINQNKTVKEICEELKIPERTYSRLLCKYGITTAKKESKANINNISQKTLQRLVDKGLSVNEICQELNINITAFYKLLKRLNINYIYAHHHGEIIINKKVLESLAKSGKPVKEISSELGIGMTTYNEKAKVAKIKTKFRDSIERISSIPKEDLQKALDNGMTISEICQKYKITKTMFKSLRDKYNLSTPQKRAIERIAQITKDDILKLRAEGKTMNEISKELQISKSSLQRILSTP